MGTSKYYGHNMTFSGTKPWIFWLDVNIILQGKPPQKGQNRDNFFEILAFQGLDNLYLS